MLVLSPKSSKRLTERISLALASGLQHHQAGRLPEAESRYREILTLHSEHPDATHLLGIIAQQTGQYAVAIELIRAAIHHNPQSADYHNNLGNTYRLQINRLQPSTAIAPHWCSILNTSTRSTVWPIP
jgi:Flp pilus assembly protein TadD